MKKLTITLITAVTLMLSSQTWALSLEDVPKISNKPLNQYSKEEFCLVTAGSVTAMHGFLIAGKSPVELKEAARITNSRWKEYLNTHGDKVVEMAQLYASKTTDQESVSVSVYQNCIKSPIY